MTGSRYCVAVPRTDENGRQLKALLDYLLDGDIDAKAIYDALGTSSSTYYRRIKEADYPNAEELRQVADRFGLSYPDLQVRFGLMSREEVWSYLESAPVTVATATETTHRGADRLAAQAVRVGSATRRTAALAVEFADGNSAQRRTHGTGSPHRDHARLCIAWSLWIRRVTWSCRWEVAATLNIALQGVAVLLMSPLASETLGHWLHALTGKWNLEDYIGHDLYIVAASAIVYNALGRLQDDHAMQRRSSSTSSVPRRCASHCCWPPSRWATGPGSTGPTSSRCPPTSG